MKEYTDFQAAAKPQPTMANREKMLILPRSSIQVHTQYVSKHYPRIFQTDLGSLIYRELHGTDALMFVCFSVSGAFPMGTQGRGNWYLEMTPQARISKQSVTLANRML